MLKKLDQFLDFIGFVIIIGFFALICYGIFIVTYFDILWSKNTPYSRDVLNAWAEANAEREWNYMEKLINGTNARPYENNWRCAVPEATNSFNSFVFSFPFGL